MQFRLVIFVLGYLIKQLKHEMLPKKGREIIVPLFRECDARMIGKPGPFQIIENESLDFPLEPPRRRYACSHYDTCLNLAAALNWDSFTCRGCCGQINETLFWRARQEIRKDGVVRTICTELPDAEFISNDAVCQEPDPKVVHLADRRQNRA